MFSREKSLCQLSTLMRTRYEKQDADMTGGYKSKLNEKNANFTFHSFLEPDGSLRERSPRSLELIVNSQGPVEFL